MSAHVEDEYLDILQNIESAIAQVYREHPDLADSNIDRVIEGLVRQYQAEERERPAPPLRLSDLEREVFENVHEMCEWRMGHDPSGSAEDPDAGDMPLLPTVPRAVIIACLKRIRKSIAFWTKQAGRQGYLDYMDQFIV